jgi:PASTA domain
MLGAQRRISFLAALAAAGAAAASASAHPDGRGRDAHCRAPRVTGMSLAAARKALVRAGCKVVVRDRQPAGVHISPLVPDPLQLIASQSPAAGRSTRTVTVWLKPLCAQSADPGPSLQEPLVTAGPTELISGLYLDGGPLRRSPNCRKGVPSPGTIAVAEAGSGRVVATQTVTSGHLATIALAPGAYLLTGTFADATVNDNPLQPPAQSVTISAGRSVREDVIANIP